MGRARAPPPAAATPAVSLRFEAHRGGRWTMRDAAGQTLGEMRFSMWTWRGELATEGATWRLRVRGLWRMRALAEDARGGEAARMDMDWRCRGRMRLADGRAFAWAPDNWAGTRWTLRDADGRTVARLRARGTWRYSADVEVVRGDAAELLLPLCVGWYAAIMSWSTAVVAAT